MTSLPTILVLAAVALAALALWAWARRARVARMGRAAQGDPLAVLQQVVDQGVAGTQRAKEVLEECRGLVGNARRLVEGSQREKARLESRIAAALAQGDPQQQAKSYAVELAEVERQLADHQQALAEHEATYRTFAAEVEAGRQRVLEARRKAGELGTELEQSQREKELAQFAAGPTPDSEPFPVEAARAEESIEQQIDKNRAAGRVAKDLAGAAPGPVAEDTAARDAAAAQILQRFQKPPGQP